MSPTGEAIALDLARIPPDLTWEWASAHLVALVRGERIQVVDEETLERVGFELPEAYVSLEMPPGVRVTFSILVGVAGMTVGPSMIERWGVTIEDVAAHALAGLRRHVRMTSSRIHVDDTHPDGITVRSIRDGPWWASSLILLPDELMAIFGSHDQILAAPYSCHLVSVPIDTDLEVVADLLDLYGIVNPESTLVGLPAFVLQDGVLETRALPEWVPSEDTVFLDDLDHWDDVLTQEAPPRA